MTYAMTDRLTAGVQVRRDVYDVYKDTVLTPEALEFMAKLQRAHGPAWKETRAERESEQAQIDARLRRGERAIDFLQDEDSIAIRKAFDEKRIRVSENYMPANLVFEPGDVELVTPLKPKMAINALTKGKSARINLLDFEDAGHYEVHHVMEGLKALMDYADGHMVHTEPSGKTYEWTYDSDEPSTIKLRPDGFGAMPMEEIWVDGEPVERGIFQLAMHFYHNAQKLMERGEGVNFYFPKGHTAKEMARLKAFFDTVKTQLGLRAGDIKVTPLVENPKLAAQMPEAVFELVAGDDRAGLLRRLKKGESVLIREGYCDGLNVGRWDYMAAKEQLLGVDPESVGPQPSDTSMKDPNMLAYVRMLVHTCETIGINPIGGMDVQLYCNEDQIDENLRRTFNEGVTQRLYQGKFFEGSQGLVSAWVAGPDSLPVASKALAEGFAQYQKTPKGPNPYLENDIIDQLLSTPKGQITRESFRDAVRVPVQYSDGWLRAIGCSSISAKEPPLDFDMSHPMARLMEDVATTERSRMLVYNWIAAGRTLTDGTPITKELFNETLDSVIADIETRMNKGILDKGKHCAPSFALAQYPAAKEAVREFVLDAKSIPYVTQVLYPAYLKGVGRYPA